MEGAVSLNGRDDWIYPTIGLLEPELRGKSASDDLELSAVCRKTSEKSALGLASEKSDAKTQKSARKQLRAGRKR